jgi:hypothetical protein
MYPGPACRRVHTCLLSCAPARVLTGARLGLLRTSHRWMDMERRDRLKWLGKLQPARQPRADELKQLRAPILDDGHVVGQ